MTLNQIIDNKISYIRKTDLEVVEIYKEKDIIAIFLYMIFFSCKATILYHDNAFMIFFTYRIYYYYSISLLGSREESKVVISFVCIVKANKYAMI